MVRKPNEIDSFGKRTNNCHRRGRYMASKFLRMAALSLCAGGLAAAPVLAENAADVARTRHDSYRDIGAAFKNINDQLKSGSPQLYVIQLSARQIRNYSQQQFSWFPAGS